MLFARGAGQQPAAPAAPASERKVIDLKSDLWGPVAPGDSVTFLVGNFAAQHNGAVITCDSAVRYSPERIEFFGNVLINKNTTYIYGDRAEYDGELNEARVYSDLVKVVDGDAVLYTYDFVFNTLDNVGEFSGGGVLTNRESRLESLRGYYYGDRKLLASVEQVEMRNEEYELSGDSVVYDLSTDNAYFFDRTNIWNRDGEYLYADRGEYRKADSLYVVTRNGYILTAKQELWSDSIDYSRVREHVVLRHDIQIDDAEHKILAFGDYGEYWKNPGDAFLTRRPSVVSYDLSQGDSLFMRSDTMFLYTISRAAEEAAARERARLDSLERLAADTLSAARAEFPGSERSDRRTTADAASAADSGSERTAASAASGTAPESPESPEQPGPAADSLGHAAADTLSGGDTVQLTPAQIKARQKEEAAKARQARKAEAAAARKAKLDEIAARRKARNAEKLDARKLREEQRLKARRLKAESKLRARRLKAARKGRRFDLVDPAVLARLDSLLERNIVETDSLLTAIFDSIDRQPAATLAADPADSTAQDSIYRLVKGYRNVRIYRSDFQTVCDSMTAISTDSTIHLYIEPVLWNENNQITSEVMDIFTERQQIVRAEFVGEPMMVSLLDTVHYNQVAGKQMTAFFRNNRIYRNDVDGNAQTIYYMQDGEPPVITMMGVIESGSISFFIEENQVVQIIYRNNPVYNFYPMDKIPETQELYLKGFRWEGARRPSQRDVFDRRIRPSERAARERLPHPDFPIQRSIDEYRRRLIEQGRWEDRSEPVDTDTEEWMRELGFEVGQPRESGPKF